MKMKTSFHIRTILFCTLFNFSLCSLPRESDEYQTRKSRTQYFDLSYSFSNDTIYFPGQHDFELHKDYLHVQKPGFQYSAYSFCMGEHGGTHIDAPIHFYAEGWTVEKIPPSHLIDVPAVLIDLEEAVNGLERPDEFLLEVKHIIDFETTHGIIPFGGVVLIHTGWSRLWPDKVKYLGWDNSTEGEGTLHFPGISEAAAKWLADERQIVGIGLDTASVDPGVSKTFPVHVQLATKQIFNIENVANLHLLLQRIKNNCSLHLFILPLKIVGGTGSPARILAYCK